MKKIKIAEFDCQIYPRLIWLAVDAPEAVLKDLFGSDVAIMTENADAMCSIETRQKPDEKSGCLIQFHKETFTETNICHESVHAALDILECVGVKTDVQHQEALAYLTGWVFKCCMEVKKRIR